MVFVRLVVVWLVAVSVMHVLLVFVAVVHVEVGVVVRLLPLRFVVFLVPVHGVVVDCSGNISGSPRYPPPYGSRTAAHVGEGRGCYGGRDVGTRSRDRRQARVRHGRGCSAVRAPMLSLFHPSLLTSLMRGEIVAVVAVVAGLFTV